MNTKRFLMAVLAVAVLGAVLGCGTAVKQVDGHRISGGYGALTMAQVENAIVQGGSQRDWTIRLTAPGQMVGTFEIHDEDSGALKQRVVVDISFDTTSYSIRYKQSENLDYDSASGKIHGDYNRWIDDLVLSIDSATRAL